MTDDHDKQSGRGIRETSHDAPVEQSDSYEPPRLTRIVLARVEPKGPRELPPEPPDGYPPDAPWPPEGKDLVIEQSGASSPNVAGATVF